MSRAKKNYLGIDFGKSRIGLAIAPQGVLAFGLKIIKNDKDVFAVLRKIVEEQEIDFVVLGAPISTQGKTTQLKKEAEKFRQELAQNFPQVETKLVDERFTSSEAKKNLPTSKRQDAEAARLILQSYLDAKKKKTR